MIIFKKIERKGKKFIFKVLQFILKPESLSQQRLKRIKNVIIVRIDERLGNVVLITPVIKSFLKNNINVTVIAASKFSQLLQTIKNIEIIEFNKKKFFNPLYLIKFIFYIRRKKYDLLFDASNPNDMSTLTFFMILFLRADIKIGFLRKNSELILNICVPLPEKEIHITDYYKILFKKLRLKYLSEVKISLPQDIKKRYINLRKEFKNRELVAVHPGGRGNKQWQVSKLLKLLELIKRDYKKYNFIIIIGPLEKRLKDIFSRRGYKIVSPVDVIDLASYFSICKIFIGNDSGPMHLASALGLKIVAVFKDTAKIHFKPKAAKYRIISASHPSFISVKQVFNAFKAIQ